MTAGQRKPLLRRHLRQSGRSMQGLPIELELSHPVIP